MGKSLRNKQKQASRVVKRKDSMYAIEEAARTARLHEKLMGKHRDDDVKNEGDSDLVKIEEDVEEVEVEGEVKEGMEVDDKPSTKVSTSGPRNSRRETWRLSKGMSARPKRESNNRQGMMKGKRKAGRPGRRR